MKHLFALLALLALAAPAAAQTEFTSVRELGMGSAFAGGGNSNGAIFHNPAGIVTAAVYSFEAGYMYGAGNSSNSLGASIVDSKTNPNVAAGFGYSYTFSNGPTDSDADNIGDHNIRGALGFPIVPQVAAIGIGAHYITYNRGTTTNDEGDQVDVQFRALSLDVGLQAVAARTVSFGIAARNLLQPTEYVPPREIAGGIGVFVDALHFEAQYLAREDKVAEVWDSGFGLGLEYTIAVVPVRLGFQRESTLGENFVTAGLGWRNEVAGADLAFRQNIDNTDDRYVAISASGYW